MKTKIFEKFLQTELDKLPYTKHLDDGSFNDGRVFGFEEGARWMKNQYFTILEELQLKLIAMSCFAQEHFNEKAYNVTKMNIDEIKHWIKQKRSQHCT